MGKYIITGGNPLYGEITVQGSKNAILPIMAGCVLHGDEYILHNAPDIKDVDTMKRILLSIGCKIKMESKTLIIDSKNVNQNPISDELVSRMRSSIILMGALLARNRYARFSMPGGCEIGLRPIDMHLLALQRLGADISDENGYIIVDGKNMHAENILLHYPSVGATENVMLASILLDGTTCISNAAKEPEVVDLAKFLNCMGAKIHGAGTENIYIEGVKHLHGCTYTVMPDRIVAGTYLCAVNMCRGKLMLKNCRLSDMQSSYYTLLESGLNIESTQNVVTASQQSRCRSVDSIITLPYPGFATDLQPVFTAMLTLAKGTSFIDETVFENRYKYTSQLLRMGAKIKIKDRIAIVSGVENLKSATVHAQDLRGGAALVLAGLSARGESLVDQSFHIERGYEDFPETLRSVNAQIRFSDS